MGSNLGSASGDLDASPRPAPLLEHRVCSLAMPDLDEATVQSVTSSQATPEASTPASPTPGSQPLSADPAGSSTESSGHQGNRISSAVWLELRLTLEPRPIWGTRSTCLAGCLGVVYLPSGQPLGCVLA